jgi:hypothetical protein
MVLVERVTCIALTAGLGGVVEKFAVRVDWKAEA